MKIFVSIAAVLAWIFGLMLLFIPENFYSPTGIKITPMLATIAQAHGATLIGMGVIDWVGRNADRIGLKAILAGNLVMQLLSLSVVIRTMTLGSGSAVVPGIVIHIILGSFFAYFLHRLVKTK